MTPDYVIDEVKKLLENNRTGLQQHGIMIYDKKKLGQSQLFKDANENATWILKMYIRTELCAKNLI